MRSELSDDRQRLSTNAGNYLNTFLLFPIHFPQNIRFLLTMKSKNLQKIVAFKHENGDYPAKAFHDLHGAIDVTTIKRRCKMIDDAGSINLASLPDRPRTRRSKRCNKQDQREPAKQGKCHVENLQLNSVYLE